MWTCYRCLRSVSMSISCFKCGRLTCIDCGDGICFGCRHFGQPTTVAANLVQSPDQPPNDWRSPPWASSWMSERPYPVTNARQALTRSGGGFAPAEPAHDG